MIKRAASVTVLSLVVAFGRAGADQGPVVTPLPPGPVPEVPPTVDSEPTPASLRHADAALERVLRSRCRDGRSVVRELLGDPAAPWAETVLRLCANILHIESSEDIPATALTDEGLAAHREIASAQEGRGRLVFWSSLYGIWLGVATDLLFDINGNRSVILPPLLGMGAGLGLSLALTADVPLTAGQAWTVITGLDYGSANGALWAASFGVSKKGTAGATVAAGIAAASAGLAIADATSPTAGDIELVRSGLLWGTVSGLLALAAFAPESGLNQQKTFRGMAIAMDAGFLIGLGLARSSEVSRNRVLIIDAGALGGGLTGLGIAWLAVSDPGGTGHVLSGAALAGVFAGVLIASYATRNIDAHPDRGLSLASAPPAVLVRDADGHWGPGAPSPLPVFGLTDRVVGATLNACAGVF